MCIHINPPPQSHTQPFMDMHTQMHKKEKTQVLSDLQSKCLQKLIHLTIRHLVGDSF